MKINIEINRENAKLITEIDGRGVIIEWKREDYGRWIALHHCDDYEFLTDEQYEVLDNIDLCELQNVFGEDNYK